jgi:hypothetical protein
MSLSRMRIALKRMQLLQRRPTMTALMGNLRALEMEQGAAQQVVELRRAAAPVSVVGRSRGARSAGGRAYAVMDGGSHGATR